MTIDSSNVKWLAERPSIPAVGPVAVHPNPCLADHRRVVDRLADTFGIKPRPLSMLITTSAPSTCFACTTG